MSFPSVSIYKDLIAAYPSWEALRIFLTGEECALRVDDYSTPDSPFAIIRYEKGVSKMSNPIVRAFRSVVWDTHEHRPASITSWKSAENEGTPSVPADPATHRIELFQDGTLIGMFWDKYSGRWRIHTRSILDARCRYYSQTRTFADMFAEATRDVDLGHLSRHCSYSWVLQHPENRIVCHASLPTAIIADVCQINADASVDWQRAPQYAVQLVPPVLPLTWDTIRLRVADLNARFGHNCQGLVIKDGAGGRWKLRTPEYNRVRQIRGNSPRRDFLWLQAWSNNTLLDYLKLYPEERSLANGVINRWKLATADVYRIYGEAFKAHSLDRKLIPQKYRSSIYGLHSLYHTTLKPAGKKVDWKACLEHMNALDTKQKLFIINYELRLAARAVDAAPIPVEPPTVAAATSVVAEMAVEAESEAS